MWCLTINFLNICYIWNKQEPTNWETLCKFHTEDYQMNALPNERTLKELQLEFTHPKTKSNLTKKATLDNLG